MYLVSPAVAVGMLCWSDVSVLEVLRIFADSPVELNKHSRSCHLFPPTYSRLSKTVTPSAHQLKILVYRQQLGTTS